MPVEKEPRKTWQTGFEQQGQCRAGGLRALSVPPEAAERNRLSRIRVGGLQCSPPGKLKPLTFFASVYLEHLNEMHIHVF